jgi:hypothetical protein
MKINFTLKNIKQNLLILLLLISVSGLLSCTVVESIHSVDHANSGTKFSRKDRAVKVYPDLVKRLMHVKNIETEPLDFFVFDLEGTLIRHFKMDEGDHRKISGLYKGLYVYQVFMGDEMSESGKIIIK